MVPNGKAIKITKGDATGCEPEPSPTDACGNQMDGINAVMAGVQEQLGLKLERGKAPVEMLVIEHVEKPAAN